LGSPAGVRVVRQRMRDLGMRSIPIGPQATTRDHPLGLTRREREVLDLLCNGLTNAEIATKLFVSTKTVEHHVSAVLAKLNAPNRATAAMQARRLGLVAAGGS
ncbi:MAG TPA: response regulator transcription factor, partial [Micromonosporaceae bacterium]|nr:response regulator transcription factor [Micromonosporaceae bacterium]